MTPSKNITLNGEVEINGNLSMNDNLINDVSGINFSDGTYIGHGSSFDISSNEDFKLIQNGNENFKVDLSGNFYFNENNMLSFNDLSSSSQNKQLPTIHNQPILLERTSIFMSDISFVLAKESEKLLSFSNTIVNQLNLSISGVSNEIISPSLDISGQFVEIYLNIYFEKPSGNNSTTKIEFDISGISGLSFFQTIDNRETSETGLFFLTFGPHMFIPSEWSGTSEFVFKLNNTSNDSNTDINIISYKIIFKSRFL